MRWTGDQAMCVWACLALFFAVAVPAEAQPGHSAPDIGHNSNKVAVTGPRWPEGWPEGAYDRATRLLVKHANDRKALLRAAESEWAKFEANWPRSFLARTEADAIFEIWGEISRYVACVHLSIDDAETAAVWDATAQRDKMLSQRGTEMVEELRLARHDNLRASSVETERALDRPVELQSVIVGLLTGAVIMLLVLGLPFLILSKWVKRRGGSRIVFLTLVLFTPILGPLLYLYYVHVTHRDRSELVRQATKFRARQASMQLELDRMAYAAGSPTAPRPEPQVYWRCSRCRVVNEPPPGMPVPVLGKRSCICCGNVD